LDEFYLLGVMVKSMLWYYLRLIISRVVFFFNKQGVYWAHIVSMVVLVTPLIKSQLNGSHGEYTETDDVDNPQRMGRRERNRMRFGGSCRRGGNDYGAYVCPCVQRGQRCNRHGCNYYHPRENEPPLMEEEEEPKEEEEEDPYELEEVTIKGCPPLSPLVILGQVIHDRMENLPEPIPEEWRQFIIMLLVGIINLIKFISCMSFFIAPGHQDDEIHWRLLHHAEVRDSVNSDHQLGYTHYRMALVYPSLIRLFRTKVCQVRITQYTYGTLHRNAMFKYSGADQETVENTIEFYLMEVRRSQLLGQNITRMDVQPTIVPST
jgi:hypothetical protein